MTYGYRFICGCVAEPVQDDRDGMVIAAVWGPTAKCHQLGAFISAAEVARARYTDAEWDRAEAEWLEQP